MSNDKDKTPAKKTLQLSRSVDTSKMQQSLSRNRGKNVMVEVKKTRTFSRDSSGHVHEEKSETNIESPSLDDTAFPGLTREEREARLRAIEQAGQQQDRTVLPSPPPRRQPKRKAEDETEESSTEKSSQKPASQEEAALAEKKKVDKEKDNLPKLKAVREEKRDKVKLTISNIYEHQEERVRSLASIKRARQKAKRQHVDDRPQEKMIREVVIPETITVQELANRMAERSQDVVKELMKLGVMAAGSESIDADTAELIVNEFGHTSKRVTDADVEDVLIEIEVEEKDLEARPPVVTIMGHVDHGKTSLLDALRESNVTGGEAGGITQHIGAYQIQTENGHKITFLDTPGHAAFTAMRQRGATVTDLVILVVAADDGIMPQTVEAINHAKAAEVPIIVAVNKIDKPEADPSRVKNELLSYELVAEEMGGDIMVVEVSAKTRVGLDKLIDTILLQAEMLELKASPTQKAVGSVIEAQVDPGRGVVTSLLVQRGTLHMGDMVIAGTGFGKIKLITDDKGKQLEEAGPSLPVEVLGLNELPAAGDTFAIVDSERQAREIIDYRKKQIAQKRTAKRAAAGEKKSLDNLFQIAKDGGKELRVLVKGDVQGSVEAIMGSLEKLENEEVAVKFIHSAAGGIMESDVTLAATTGAIILGFNVRASNKVKEMAQDEGVDIRYYSVIYDLIDDMKAAVGGMMSPIIRENFLGNAEILEVFKITKVGKVAGCVVRNGVVKRGAGVRLIRDDVVIHEGKLKTLKRFKEEVAEVKEGTECGMAFENYEDIKAGDTIEAFELIEEAAKID